MFEHELKNAYIGYVREPGENTIGYRPFRSDIKDYSGNGNDFYVQDGSMSYANNLAYGSKIRHNGDLLINKINFTAVGWFNTFNSASWQFNSGTQYGWHGHCGIGKDGISCKFAGDNNRYGITVTASAGTHLSVGVRDGTNMYFYIDGVLKGSTTCPASAVMHDNYNSGSYIGNYYTYSGSFIIGECILEDKARTAAEVLNYYNSTKTNYGIS